jgi:hypothetical protein
MMMTDEPIKKVKSISLGWAKPDDAIYTGGWNFLSVLNPNLVRSEAPIRGASTQPSPTAQDS